jgi:hypothetical protein
MFHLSVPAVYARVGYPLMLVAHVCIYAREQETGVGKITKVLSSE